MKDALGLLEDPIRPNPWQKPDIQMSFVDKIQSKIEHHRLMNQYGKRRKSAIAATRREISGFDVEDDGDCVTYSKPVPQMLKRLTHL